ncbi:MAG TPA: SOS response-associated peptidase [Candidatus Limnocylindrales bacterium]|nr:SOS response-associated peptidase [Candidatus Limnocylindrales bacterium]
MCGRFALATEGYILEMLFQLDVRADFQPRYNIAPSQEILAMRLDQHHGNRELAWFKWGLVPFWAKDTSISGRLINARSETADAKPAFREAYKRRRLLIPASGFYEWKKEKEGKRPYYICAKDGSLFALAGLWERWGKGDPPLESCTILTTAANALLAPIHDRMPVILLPEAYDRWLDPETTSANLADLLAPCPAEMLTAFPVSHRVNRPANDTPDLIMPEH